MDSHDGDPRTEDPADPWDQASAQFDSLTAKLRERYAELVGENGPDEEDVRHALKTLGSAAQSVVESIGSSMREPEVREQLKDATSSFFSAIGQTLSRLGDELRETVTQEENEPPGDDEFEALSDWIRSGDEWNEPLGDERA